MTIVARWPLAIALLAAIVLGNAAAQERYEDPHGRFAAPIPAGWTATATPDVLTLHHTDPDGTLHLLAPVGAEMDVVAAALAILVDPGLDAAFATNPLRTSAGALPSGTWTQRSYQHGDDIIAAISLEVDGHTLLLLAQGTQAAFMQAVNAATNEVLLGLEVLIDEPTTEDAGDLPYDVIATHFASGDATLAGTLTLPHGDGPHPGIVLVSGSGAQDRDGMNPGMPGYRPLRWLADHLTRHGLAVLRFDERGIADSTGDHEAATTADLADDVAAGLRHLARADRVDTARVGLLGHSEGSVIVGRVAAELGDEVAFVITMAGPAFPYAEIAITQVERIAAASGAEEAEIAEAVTRQRDVVALALAEDWEGLEAHLVEVFTEQVEALAEDELAQLGDPEALIAQQVAANIAAFQSPWLCYFFAYDPRDDLRRITAPVLVLFGGLDVQVDVEQNRGPFEAALAEAGNDDVTVVVFPRANHLFQEAVTGGPEEYMALEMAFLPGFLETISDWLSEQLPMPSEDPMAMMFLLFDDDYRAINFRSMDRFFPWAPVEAGGDVWELAYDLRELTETYTFGGETADVGEFLRRTETTSLIVAQGDAIRYEAYFRGYDDAAQATSWSVAKSFVSALVGIAVDEGSIGSIDDPISDYVPRLIGSGYEGVPIVDVLTMSSGIAFDEDYENPEADINAIFIQMMGFERPIDDYVASLQREREPGAYHEYASSDTHALAMLLEAATGTPLAELAQAELWEPLGMESDAFWSTDRHGQAIGFCCLNAVPRDYLRFGMLYANEGRRDGRQIVPRQWVIDSVNPTAAHLQPGENPDSFWTLGYGYKWWIPEEPRGDFLAIGVWGQYIYVDPTRDVVIVKTSTDFHFDENDLETIAVFRAIADDFAEMN